MKTKNKCPLCGGFYTLLSRHLQDVHDLTDPTKRRLIISQNSLRYGGKLRCPIKDCATDREYVRLDKHLISFHGKKTGRRLSRLMSKAKKAAIKDNIQALSQSTPTQSPPAPASPTPPLLPPMTPPPVPPPTPPPLSPPTLSPVAPLTLPPPAILSHKTLPPPALQTQNGGLPPPTTTLTNLANGLQTVKEKLLNLVEVVEFLQAEANKLTTQLPPTPSASTLSSPFATPAATNTEPAARRCFVSPSCTLPMAHLTSTPGSLTPNLDHLLDSFEAYLIGPNQSHSSRKNIKQRRAYVKKFLQFMAGKGTDINRNLVFLSDMAKLNQYLNHLGSTLKPTSQKHVILDIEAFLRFLKLSNIPKVRTTVKFLNCFLEKLGMWKKALRSLIVKQRADYKRKKKANLVEAQNMLRFSSLAEREIKSALSDLTKDPKSIDNLARVVGLLVGMMIMETGHRKCVFLGMTPDDILNAQEYKKTFAIRVSDHKTVQTYGPATVAVKTLIMEYLKAFGKLRPVLPGFRKQPKAFFFNSSGGEMDKMGLYFTRAWKNLGLPGSPTLRDIRTAIATWADCSLTAEKTEAVNKSMCHDPKTAQKFYVVGPEATPQQARSVRLNILRSLVESSNLPARGQEVECQEEEEEEESHHGDSEESQAEEEEDEESRDQDCEMESGAEEEEEEERYDESEVESQEEEEEEESVHNDIEENSQDKESHLEKTGVESRAKEGVEETQEEEGESKDEEGEEESQEEEGESQEEEGESQEEEGEEESQEEEGEEESSSDDTEEERQSEEEEESSSENSEVECHAEDREGEESPHEQGPEMLQEEDPPEYQEEVEYIGDCSLHLSDDEEGDME